jgi:chemotaxis protein methyltransferase CheR
MKDSDCVQFLQWILPRLQMRWPGFRKVRGQVCKRIERRIRTLQLSDLQSYRDYLEDNQNEWSVLDGLCRVTVSRFYRDKQVFDMLEHELLPRLATQALGRGETCLRIWSAGCASGEEPYTVALLWEFGLRESFTGLDLQVLATDADPQLLQRARDACFAYGSVKNLPEEWRNRAFTRSRNDYHLLQPFRERVEFQLHDVRNAIPDGPFHLVLCRNLVFTYFNEVAQRDFLKKVRNATLPQGLLMLGVREHLPEGETGYHALSARLGIYEKVLSS